jgi:NAD(P)-dependent dehydrogenase (short-subunit alcohol dehydrogenase family)
VQEPYERSGHAAYGASKLALNMWSYRLAGLVKGQGVTVNCVDPGTVNTKLLHHGWGDVAYCALRADVSCGVSAQSCLSDTTNTQNTPAYEFLLIVSVCWLVGAPAGGGRRVLGGH